MVKSNANWFVLLLVMYRKQLTEYVPDNLISTEGKSTKEKRKSGVNIFLLALNLFRTQGP